MPSKSKLRVAIADGTHALEAVTVEVERATGFVAQPVLQEIDYTDLVVEVQLTDSNAADPRRIALTVARANPDLDVLSSWKEAAAPADLAAVQSIPMVVDATDPLLPEVARRALRDEVPTAQWLPKFVAGGDRSWILALPSRRSGRPARVGICSRRGYSARFSASEVKRALQDLDH